MIELKEVFAQQTWNEPNAAENVKEVAGEVEKAGIATYTTRMRETIYILVSDSDFSKAFDIVYKYWHLGNKS